MTESMAEYGGKQEPAQAGKYQCIGAAIGYLVDTKQKAYGRSFDRMGEVFRLLYPTGIKPQQYDDVLAIARVMDKIFRVAAKKDAFGESPWADIAGYALLMNKNYGLDEKIAG